MVFLAICAGGAVALTVYAHWHKDIFRRIGVPCAPSIPFLGSLHTYFWIGNNVDVDAYHLQNFGSNNGKLVGTFDGRQPVLLIADAEMIHSVLQKHPSDFCDRKSDNDDPSLLRLTLISLSGSHWKHVRQLVTPIFTTGSLRRIAPLIANCVDYLVRDLKRKTRKNDLVDARNLSNRFTLRTIASIAFGMEIGESEKEDCFIQAALSIFEDPNRWIISLLGVIFPHIVLAVLIVLGALKIKTNTMRNLDIFSNLIAAEIGRRKRENFTRDDFLQSMIALEEIPPNKDLIKRTGLTREEIIAQSLMFLEAAYETTASTLTFFCLAMAQNLECQNCLREELKVIKNDAEMTPEGVSSLPYLEMCLNETLRLYPIVSRCQRVCTAKEGTDICGVEIPCGLGVAIPTVTLHNMAEIWPHPKRFDPKRFAGGIPESAAAFYLPFGAGPRGCIGEKLAKLELRIAIVTIFRKYRVELSEHSSLSVNFAPVGLRIPMDPVYLRFIESPLL